MEIVNCNKMPFLGMRPELIINDSVFNDEIEKLDYEIEKLKTKRQELIKLKNIDFKNCNLKEYTYQNCVNRLELVTWELVNNLHWYQYVEETKESIFIFLNYFDCLQKLKKNIEIFGKVLAELNYAKYHKIATKLNNKFLLDY